MRLIAWLRRFVRLLRWSGWLADLERLLRTQDNRATAWPLYVVQEQERIYGIDLDYACETTPYIWQYRDDPEYSHETDNDLRDEYPNERWALSDHCVVRVESKEGHVWERVYYARRCRFVCAHLTERAAEAYIRANAHNLTSPRVYVTSQHRCYEWQGVMRILGAPNG